MSGKQIGKSYQKLEKIKGGYSYKDLEAYFNGHGSFVMKDVFDKHSILTILQFLGYREQILVSGKKINSPWYLCRCECGKEKEINGYKLVSQQVRSCGCLQHRAASQIGKSGKCLPHYGFTILPGWYIYKHTAPSGKSYIGQSRKPPELRWGLEGQGYKRKNHSIMAQAIKKYGWENFTHEILEEGIPTQELANEREQYWIQFYDTYKHGYNATEGGDTATSPLQIVYCIDTQTMQIIQVYKSTKEAAQDFSLTESTINRALIGKNRTAGGYYWCYESNYSEDWKPKEVSIRKITNNRPVVQLSQEGNIIREFNSQKEAARAIGVKGSQIHTACNKMGVYTVKGYFWCYKENLALFTINTVNRCKRVYKIENLQLKKIQEYCSITEAAQSNPGYLIAGISQACRCHTPYKGNYWCFVEDFEDFVPAPNLNIRACVCFETQEKFTSGTEVIAKYPHISSTNLSRACLNPYYTAGGYHWYYPDDYQDKIFIIPHKKQVHHRPVQCVETKEIFESAIQVKKKYGYDNSTIDKACKNGRRAYGFLWKYWEGDFYEL